MKHNSLIRIIGIIIALLMLFCTVSCGNESSDGTNDESTAGANLSETTAPSAETSKYIADDLPEDLNFNGKEVRILVENYNNAYYSDLYSPEATGDRYADSVFAAVKAVEERLNVKLSYIDYPYVYSERIAFINEVMKTLLSGDSSYDLIMGGYLNFSSTMSMGNCFVDLSNTKYIDLEKPWYNQTVIDNAASDYIFFVSGDFSVGNVKNTFAIYANADLYKSLGKEEDLYDIVDSGKWTFSKLDELIKDTYADLDGDNTPNAGDRYGLTFGDVNKYIGFLTCCGGRMFTKTGVGYEFTYNSERLINCMDIVTKLVGENKNVLPAQKDEKYRISSTDGNYVCRLFMEGRALFTCSLVADAATIAPNITFDYALLPYPKLDESQEKYEVSLQRSAYALIPTTSADVDASGAVLEALSSEFYRSVMPVYCEVTLKTRYAQDEDVSRMFELINQSIVYDAGYIYRDALSDPHMTFRNIVGSGTSSTWSSAVAALEKTLKSKMDQVVKEAAALGKE